MIELILNYLYLVPMYENFNKYLHDFSSLYEILFKLILNIFNSKYFLFKYSIQITFI